MWWQLLIICLVFYTVGLVGYLFFEKWQPRQRNKPLKNPERVLKTEQILGRSRFKISHSRTEVRHQSKTENGAENKPIFAPENKKEVSEKEFEECPDVDAIPLSYEAKESDAINLEQEGEEEVSAGKDATEYAGGVDMDSLMKAYSTLSRSDATPQEREQAAQVLSELQKTHVMEQLRKDPRRAARIDELINERFARLSKAMRQGDGNGSGNSNAQTDDFTLSNYLPS